MADNWTENIIRQWQTENVNLNPGASLDEIVAAEKTLDFIFPDQFKDLYAKVNGFKDNDW